MGFRLAYLQLTSTNHKVQCHGHAHFDSDYLGNGDRKDKITIAIKYQVMYGRSIGILTFDIGPL